MTQASTAAAVAKMAEHIASGYARADMVIPVVREFGGMFRHTASTMTDTELATVLVQRGWTWADVLRRNA